MRSYFYGRLKNLQGAALDAAVDEALKSVNLAEAATRQKLSGEYSGGMKRRLSVAISLIGNPLVVYLDEPSTGLDPASRHQLWEAILKVKKDRTIILTTHSMEEAEVLCDKIGIFVAGELRCFGAPQNLTHRYGSNYSLTVTANHGMLAQAKDLLTNLAPGLPFSRATHVPWRLLFHHTQALWPMLSSATLCAAASQSAASPPNKSSPRWRRRGRALE